MRPPFLTTLGAWPLRVAWFLLPLLAGPTLAAALDDTATGFRTATSIGLWLLWAAALAALLVPCAVTLTAVRLVVPAALVAAVWATVVGEGNRLDEILAVTATTAAAGLLLAPGTGDHFVNGSSYGDERRMALRAPAPLLVGPVPVAWAAAVGGTVAGPLLVFAGAWLAGAAVTIVGAPVALLAARAVHGLSRRWVVFVPAGLVLHDPMALGDPVLFPRRTIARLGPAPADTDALDLTQHAAGLALELHAVEPVALTLASGGRHRDATATRTERLLFTPTRPGALLAEARRRRIAVG